MNWIDFNIICVGEKRPKTFKNDYFSTQIMNRNCNKSQKCYIEKWDILNRIQGIWYEFWSKDEEYDFLINSDWKIDESSKCDESPLGHGYRLYVDFGDCGIIGELLKFYVNQSPIKQIIVLFRHQGHECERFHNRLSVEEFLSMLVNKDIYGNVAYIVGE